MQPAGASPRFARVVVALPDRILLVAAVLAVTLFATASTGIFLPAVAIPVFVVLLAVAWRLMPVPTAATRAGWITALLVVLAAIAWVAVQSRYTAESVVAWRDPGIYALQGIWLAQHGHLAVPVAEAARLAAGLHGATAAIGPWYVSSPPTLALQGSAGLPSFVGLGWWVGGLNGALVINLGIGALALIALYAAARRIVGPVWALLPTLILSVSMPMAVFSRAPYSEILVVLLYLSGLVWLKSAFDSRRPRDFAIAGALVGLTGFVRIDSSIALAGAAAAFGVAIAFVVRPEDRRPLLQGYLRFAGIGGTLFALALLALWINSPQYLRSLGKETLALVAATALVAVVAGLIAMVSVSRGWRQWFAQSRKPAFVVAGIVAAAFLFWASRPLWLVSRLMFKPAYQQAVELYQKLDGLGVDGHRSYEEQTLWWTAWYFGVVFLIAAAAGIVFLLYRALRSRDPWALVVVGVTLAGAALYLDVVRITPDQIWAYRRFTPFVLPGFLLAAAVVLAKIGGRRWWMRAIVGVASLAIVAQTAIATQPVFGLHEGQGQKAEVAAACAAVTSDVVVQLGDQGPGNFALSLKVMCGRTVITVANSLRGNPTELRATLASIRERNDGKPVDVLTFDRKFFIATGSSAKAPVFSQEVITLGRHIAHIPNDGLPELRTMWVGTVGESGTVVSR